MAGMATDPKDWLWGLDCIQRELDGLLPASNLHVAFPLKIETRIHSSTEIDRFPFGQFLSAQGSSPAMYEDRETGALWFDLGCEQLP